MRLFTALLLVIPAYSAELDTKILRLIPDDAEAVFGADRQRFRGSGLSQVVPYEEPYRGYFQVPGARAIVFAHSKNGDLAIFQGAVFQEANSGYTSTRETRGDVSVVHTGPVSSAILSEGIVIAGEGQAVESALERRANFKGELNVAAMKARQLSATFDNWFYLARPMEQINGKGPNVPTRYFKDLVDSVEEASGGFQLGGIIRFQVDVVAKRAEDAQTLAGVAKWLPALMESKGGSDVKFIATLQDLETRASGNVATMRFSIQEEKLLELKREDERPK